MKLAISFLAAGTICTGAGLLLDSNPAILASIGFNIVAAVLAARHVRWTWF